MATDNTDVLLLLGKVDGKVEALLAGFSAHITANERKHGETEARVRALEAASTTHAATKTSNRMWTTGIAAVAASMATLVVEYIKGH